MLIERQTELCRMKQQAAMFARAMGEDAEVPSLDDELDLFDQALAEPPAVESSEDRERAELLTALGIGK